MTTATARQTVRHLDLALRLHHAADVDCLSPLSVSSALGITAAATAGQAHDQLVGLLGDPADLRAELTAATADPGGDTTLALANTVWTRADVPVHAGFREAVTGWGDVRPAPFTNPEPARRMINAEIAKVTHDLIPQLLMPGVVDANTRAVIVNALYLKAPWTTKFPRGRTADRPFRDAGEVPTMNVTDSFGYAAADGWQAVTLPVAGAVEAAVLLPDGDLASTEPATADGFAALLAATRRTRLDLFLPRFTVRSRVRLAAALADLGVYTIFTSAADFSPLTDVRLTVSAIEHEAVLRVDEDGFEGAAATATMMRMAMVRADADPLTVRVDRPFLFLLRHTGTGAVYFLTRVTLTGTGAANGN